jgi:hypothetical protein
MAKAKIWREKLSGMASQRNNGVRRKMAAIMAWQRK